MEQVSSGRKYFSSTRIAVIAMFATIAGILYIFNFAMPFAFPSFLEFKFSDIPVLIGTFTLGPVSGVIIVVVEILIKLVFKGTSTVFVGELSDLVTSCVFAVLAGLIYSKRRTFKGALLGMAVGTVAEVAVAILFNWLVLVPFYVQFFFHGSWEPLVKMMTPLFPNCTKETFYNFYLWASILPFNLLRCVVAVLVTLPVYKRISLLINRFNAKMAPKPDEGESKAKRINIGLIVGGAVILALLVLFALLRYFVFEK
ncbi:MAG: ECF transporter S component [Clostridia bacterium]|nr:ECF transporter S component [Clostridia bacterium]